MNKLVLNADEFCAAWGTRFAEYSYNNPMYAQLCLHLAMGQVVRHIFIIKHGIRIDGRFNVFLVQSSGSGKSTALPFVIGNTDNLGLRFESITDWSDAALIGTIENKMDEKSQAVYDKVEGLLGMVDILHIDEASLLFQPTKYNQSTLSLLQIALNPIGSPSNRVRKKLAHGEAIEIYPHMSLFLTSYNPAKVSELVAQRGIMQRMAIYVRFLNSEERLQNALVDIDYLGVPSIDGEHLEEQIRTTMSAIADHYGKEENTITFDEKIKPLLKTLARRLHESTVNINPYLKDQINSFFPRYLTMLYVVSMHHAAMRLASVVSDKDVMYAYKMVKAMYDSVVVWLESEMGSIAERKTRDRKAAVRAIVAVFNEIAKDGKVSRAKLVRVVGEKTGRSTSMIYKDLSEDPEIGRMFVVDKVIRRKE